MTEPATATLDAALAPAADRPLPGLRAWFGVFLLWMGGLATLALLMFARYEQGEAVAIRVWLLALMCFYVSLCNAFVPLPTAWIILLAALPEFGLFEADWLRVITVASLGAVATVMANLNEYHTLAFFFRYGLGRRIRRTNVYQWAIRWFNVAPFQTLALIGFVPIPIDAVRWLAVLRHYSRLRFALAYFVGRGGATCCWRGLRCSYTSPAGRFWLFRRRSSLLQSSAGCSGRGSPAGRVRSLTVAALIG